MPQSRPAPDAAARIQIRRIYDPAQESDGKRVLVDRLWPRGMAKERARLDLWCKEIAPSDALRHWFHANPGQWQEFGTRYRTELAARDDLIREFAGYAADGTLTLLYGSRDGEHNNAAVLREYLRQWLARG